MGGCCHLRSGPCVHQWSCSMCCHSSQVQHANTYTSHRGEKKNKLLLHNHSCCFKTQIPLGRVRDAHFGLTLSLRTCFWSPWKTGHWAHWAFGLTQSFCPCASAALGVKWAWLCFLHRMKSRCSLSQWVGAAYRGAAALPKCSWCWIFGSRVAYVSPLGVVYERRWEKFWSKLLDGPAGTHLEHLSKWWVKEGKPPVSWGELPTGSSPRAPVHPGTS